MEMPLEVVWVGQQVGWGRISGNHHGGANGINQVDGAPNIATMCACRLSAVRLNKETMSAVSISV
mgnify:CR=1 FL=1